MQPLRFALIGDFHMGDEPHPQAAESLRLVNALPVEFALFIGDLVNRPTEPALRNFVEVLKVLRKPFYLTLGNHDTGEAPAGDDFAKRLSDLAPGPWSESFTYAFEHGGWRFVIGGMTCGKLDMQGPQIQRHKGFVSEHGGILRMPRHDLERFEQLLAEGDGPIVAATHVPLVRMSRRVHARGLYDQVHLLEELQALALMEACPRVKLALSGHQHWNQVSEHDGILHVVTQAVKGYPPYKDPDAIRIFELEPGRVRSYLAWPGREPEPAAPIGTLEGDCSFEWTF